MVKEETITHVSRTSVSYLVQTLSNSGIDTTVCGHILFQLCQLVELTRVLVG